MMASHQIGVTTPAITTLNVVKRIMPMPYILTMNSLDDEEETISFDTLDAAVAHAVEWFVDGYNNDTIDRDTRIAVAVDAVELARDLREGREFHCGRFHETVSVRHVDGAMERRRSAQNQLLKPTKSMRVSR